MVLFLGQDIEMPLVLFWPKARSIKLCVHAFFLVSHHPSCFCTFPK